MCGGGRGEDDGPQNVSDHCAQKLRRKLKLGDLSDVIIPYVYLETT